MNETLRNQYAEDINYNAQMLLRVINVNHKLDLNVGDFYNNQGRVESWTYGEGDFEPLPGQYQYAFICKNVPCHQVDYENEEECEAIGATDCQDELEALVKANAIMKIKYVANDEDYDQMGYYEVQLSFEGFKA